MIPSRDKPKYKPLVRLRADVYGTLENKKFYFLLIIFSILYG